VAVALRRLFANRPNFAVQFIRARDAKTHPERNAEPGGLQMSELTRVATYLFEASIMLDLGFDESQCAALFERQQEYLYLADRHPSTEN
jgi:hypothetical protein